VLNPLLLAYLLAYIVHPFVLKLERRGWSRMRAVNTIYLLAMAGGLVLSIAFWNQGSNLFQRVLNQTRGGESGLFTNLDRRFGEFVEEHQESSWARWLMTENVASEETEGVATGAPERDGEVGPSPEVESPEVESPADSANGATQDSDPTESKPAMEEGEALHLLPALQRVFNEVLMNADSNVAGTAARRGVNLAQSLFGSMLGLISMLVLLPIYTWFLLFDLEKIHGFVRSYFPAQERKRFTKVGQKIGEAISSFFRGQLLVCFLKGLTISIGLSLMGVPYALFLGLTAGFAALIPFFGASMAAVFTFLVGLLGPAPIEVMDASGVLHISQPSVAFLSHLLRTVIVFGVAELLEGYVFVPRIIGGSLGLNPLVVLVSVFAGGAALGMFGFLIALPLTATLVILAKEIVLPALKEWADEAPREEPEAPA
jgi:predicted PurR-regulated permease PerM